MKILWLSALLPFVLSQTEFGTSYLKNSQLCAQWTCLNNHLGLSDALPPRVQYETILRALLPVGPWQDAVGPVLDTCYGDRPRRYTSTCPGQALLHCVVDQLIQNCPAENWITKDACAPLSSLAGLRYMFSQSRYNDIELNLPSDHRPAWFLKNYFNVKCCDIPPLFSDQVLQQCGFNSIIHYYKQRTRILAPTSSFKVEKKPTDDGFAIQVVPFDNVAPPTPSVKEYGEYDPLDCCDMHEFISPSWRSECDFETMWNSDTRLSIKNTTAPTTTTTENPRVLKAKDVKMVPQSCTDNNCVFKALNIVSDDGVVDIDAFSKLLNNLTDEHPAWVKAKGRVITKCLSKPIRDYEYDCQINNVLACTFDVLSENCPNSRSPDVCRHSGTTYNEVICQISSSKYRPKNRRLFCGIPNLVNHEVLLQCNMNSLIHLEYVPETVLKPRTTFSSVTSLCKDSTPSTVCLMDKMGVLNKYNFMDYFKMKDRIRAFSYGEWFPYNKAFTAVFQTVPRYRDHCSSPKKLLNVIDTMLMTCPASKRRNTPQCNKLFFDLNKDILREGSQNEELIYHFGHVILTNQHLDIGLNPQRKYSSPLFDFGILNSENAPPVRIIDLRSTEKPLVLLPVYQRTPLNLYHRDPALRSAPISPNSV
ncbi:uncharacterized protein [Epargyreus clarus]|uniref:uncharacterized protein n=1 Tax=Epargyreus clarus TaxID=520877 RepID=UPI003C2C2A37